jgi:peroxidase
MAPTRLLLLLVAALVVLQVAVPGADAQLSAGFYSASCPSLNGVVRQVMSQAVANNSRSGAAILRLFFHDCFVNVGRRRLAAASFALRFFFSFTLSD